MTKDITCGWTRWKFLELGYSYMPNFDLDISIQLALETCWAIGTNIEVNNMIFSIPPFSDNVVVKQNIVAS